MLNQSSVYYNITWDKMGTPQITTTYSKLFASLQFQFIDMMFIAAVGFLILTLAVLEHNRKNIPSWMDIYNGSIAWESDPSKCKSLLLRSFAMICFPLSLFFILLMISVKFNLNW